MRRIVVLIAVTALAAPAAALATKPPQPGSSNKPSNQPSVATPSPKSLAVHACKTERRQGLAAFRQHWGTNKNRANAMSRCLHASTISAQSSLNSAAKQCKAWQNDPTAWMDYQKANNLDQSVTFVQHFGGNTKAKGSGAGKNAFGKCVSSLAKQQTSEHTTAIVKASKQCKTQRNTDAQAFEKAYGSKKNAFGKCVSKLSKTK